MIKALLNVKNVKLVSLQRIICIVLIPYKIVLHIMITNLLFVKNVKANIILQLKKYIVFQLLKIV